MYSYELRLLLEGSVASDRQSELLETFEEITLSIDPFDRLTIIGQFDGESAVFAARNAIDRLHGMGFKVCRLVEDYVDRAEISDRVDFTRQCIGNWINRKTGPHFPRPAHRVPGEIWLWADVVAWLEETGRKFDTLETHWPSQTCHDIINGELARLERNDEFHLSGPFSVSSSSPAPEKYEAPATIFAREPLDARWISVGGLVNVHTSHGYDHAGATRSGRRVPA